MAKFFRVVVSSNLILNTYFITQFFMTSIAFCSFVYKAKINCFCSAAFMSVQQIIFFKLCIRYFYLQDWPSFCYNLMPTGPLIRLGRIQIIYNIFQNIFIILVINKVQKIHLKKALWHYVLCKHYRTMFSNAAFFQWQQDRG